MDGPHAMASRESALRGCAGPLHASVGSARLGRTKKREVRGSLKEAGRQKHIDSPAFGVLQFPNGAQL
jgi:hypothetical protein